MKLYKPNKLQKNGFWFSMPFITLALNYIMYDERLFHSWEIWVGSTLIIYAIGIVSWYSHVQYDKFAERKYPSLEKTRQRIIVKSLVTILVMTPSILLIFFLYDGLSIYGYHMQEGDLKYGIIVGFTINIIFQTLWEVVYIIDKYKEWADEKEMMEQMHLKQEFENLKQKVNPHFLFNCFNTLSSLIAEDKDQAEKFLDELSKVYRYLLRNNANSMSTVAQEINFIESYYELLKTRHGEGIQMQLNIKAEHKSMELPALSLQLLLENAVKHNIISKQQPITVEIGSVPEEDRLSIENNMIKKVNKVESTGVGLNIIREKYRLLHREDVTIEEKDERFVVTLPLV